jgi:hypothetical protein
MNGIFCYYIHVGEYSLDKATAYIEKEKERLEDFIEILRNQKYEILFIPIRHGDSRIEVIPIPFST